MRTQSIAPLTILVMLGLIATMALAGSVGAAGHEVTLTAQLSGSSDTDEDGSGTASVVLNPGEGTACWEMTVENIDPVTISHIHVGAEGEDGPVAVDLDLDGFEATSEGCNEAADADALQAIIDNPSGYYVNVHNEPFPMGAIRGQLAAEPPDTALPVRTPGTLTMLGILALAAAAILAARLILLPSQRG